jgi:hypothetical protein
VVRVLRYGTLRRFVFVSQLKPNHIIFSL